jgi:hypothetical protein
MSMLYSSTGPTLGLVGIDPFNRGVWDKVSHEQQRRRLIFDRAQNYYRGRFKPTLRIITTPDGISIDDNVYLNYCKPVVDKSVDFLFGKGITFEISATDQQQTAEEKYLEEVWRYNKREILLRQIAMSGAIFGHVFIKIELPDAQLGEKYPRLLLLPPETVWIECDPHDVAKVTRYIIQYEAWNPQEQKTRVYRQEISPVSDAMSAWKVVDYVQAEGREHTTESRKNGGWIEVRTTPWDYEFPPIVDCQNLPAPNEYWGTPDLDTDQLDLQDSINFTSSNIARIQRFHAHPKTWGKGFQASQLQIAVNEMVVLPGKDASLQNLEMQSDLHSSLAYLAELRSSFFAISRVPETLIFKLDNVSRLTGIALMILYQPLVDKTTQKRATYGEMLTELCQRVLELAHYKRQDDLLPKWPNMLAEDPQVEVQTAAQKVQAKLLSRQSAMRLLGHDPSIEQPQINKEANDDLEQQRKLLEMQSEIQQAQLEAQTKLQNEQQMKLQKMQLDHQKEMAQHQAQLGIKQQQQQADVGLEQQQQQSQLELQHSAQQAEIDTQVKAQQADQQHQQQLELASHQSALRMQEQQIKAKTDAANQQALAQQQAKLRPKTVTKLPVRAK